MPINALSIFWHPFKPSPSALPLLVAGFCADYVDHPAAAHDLAVLADLLD
jgi:hypothetical protein